MSKHSYFEMTPSLAADHKRRLPCLALVAGREALIEDALESTRGAEFARRGGQRWMWPGPGDLEPAKIGGRRDDRSIYDIKLRGAVLDNVWERSLREVAAQPFTREPTLTDWPSPLVETDESGVISGWVMSLGGQGESLLDIWRETFFQKIALGIYYQLIDLPAESGGAPYWASVNPAQITRIVPPLPGGLLREVAIKVPAPGADAGPVQDPDKLPEESMDSWWVRVYRTSAYNGGAVDGPVLFRHVAKAEEAGGKDRWVEEKWVELEARIGTFVPIPLLPFYGKRIAAYRGAPEFADATSSQMELWRCMADYGMRKVRDYRNLLVVSGASIGEVKQSASLVALPDANARGVQIETTGMAQKAAREDHESLRHRIRWSTMRKIQQTKPQPQQTATEIHADVRGAGSWLEAQVLIDIATVQLGMQWTAQLGGLDGSKGTADLHHDFAELPGSWETLERLYVEDKVPDDLFWREFHRRGGIAAREDPEEIAKEVDSADIGS